MIDRRSARLSLPRQWIRTRKDETRMRHLASITVRRPLTVMVSERGLPNRRNSMGLGLVP